MKVFIRIIIKATPTTTKKLLFAVILSPANSDSDENISPMKILRRHTVLLKGAKFSIFPRIACFINFDNYHSNKLKTLTISVRYAKLNPPFQNPTFVPEKLGSQTIIFGVFPRLQSHFKYMLETRF